MKRILVLAMCFLVVCSYTVLASADNGGIYENAGELYAAWTSQNCLPDYITGVWSTDGGYENLTFGVVKGEDGEKGRQEILSLVRNDASVTIVYQTYSRNYLYRIQRQIEDAYFEAGLGLVAAGVKERENIIGFWIHKDYAENADTLAMIQQVTAQYGNVVSFSYVDAYPQFVAGTQPAPTSPMLVMPNPQNHMTPFVFAFGLCMIVLAFFFLIERPRRLAMAAAVARTPVVTIEQSIRQKQVEEAIRTTQVKPSSALDHRVMQSIRSDS